MSVSAFRIGNREIGPGHPTYLIAELSANHGQNYDEAVRLIHAVKEAGADAVIPSTANLLESLLPQLG